MELLIILGVGFLAGAIAGPSGEKLARFGARQYVARARATGQTFGPIREAFLDEKQRAIQEQAQNAGGGGQARRETQEGQQIARGGAKAAA